MKDETDSLYVSDHRIGMSPAMTAEIESRMDDYAHMLYSDGEPQQSIARAKLIKISLIEYIKERMKKLATEAYDKGVEDGRICY